MVEAMVHDAGAVGVVRLRPWARRRALSRRRPALRGLPPLPPVRAPVRAAVRRTSPARPFMARSLAGLAAAPWPAMVRSPTLRPSVIRPFVVQALVIQALVVRAAAPRGRGLRAPRLRWPRGRGPLPGVPLGAGVGGLLGAPPPGVRFGRFPGLDLGRPLGVPPLGPPGAAGARAALPIRPTPRTRDRLGHLLSASSGPPPRAYPPRAGY
ncbi:hypothetical protein FMEAI12_3650049 [Parafrankia sp. Ea1.12]|nr:hypothetical protein FMEAI12_3650049 [Parafrankia sp. Ea1.12]